MLGVLRRITHPMGYQSLPCPALETSVRAIKEAISKKVDAYVTMLQQSAEDCKEQFGVRIKVKISAGIPIKNVILREVLTSKASWLILDRQLKRDMKLYVKHIPCKVALVDDSLCVKVLLRNHGMGETESAMKHKRFCLVPKAKVVPT